MPTISLHALLRKRALVARETARGLKQALADAVAAKPGVLDLDLAGIDVVSPSFFDELMKMVAPLLAEREALREIRLEHSPIELATFQSILDTWELEAEQKRGVWHLVRRARRPGLGGR